jgi:hypothetical protein
MEYKGVWYNLRTHLEHILHGRYVTVNVTSVSDVFSVQNDVFNRYVVGNFGFKLTVGLCNATDVERESYDLELSWPE